MDDLDKEIEEIFDEKDLDGDAQGEDALKKGQQELEEKNRRLYARAKKAEEEARKLKQKLGESLEDQDAPTRKTEDHDLEEFVELRVAGYTKDEIEKMRQIAKGSGRSLAEVEKDPFVQAGITGLRNQKSTDDSTPPPSSKVPPITKKKIDWASMTEEERRKNFSTHRELSLKRKRGN